MAHVCPWWLAYSFDNVLRRAFMKPEAMFGEYVRPGMTVADVGCGMGFNSIALARMVGEEGRVISLDVQAKTLDVLRKRAARAGVAERIETREVAPDSLGLREKVGFAVAFWMIHEAPDSGRLLGEIAAALEEGAVFFAAEPRGHVSEEAFERMVQMAGEHGLRVEAEPVVRLSRAVVLRK